VTALIAWPNFYLLDGREVAKQVAAPAVTRMPNLHRAENFAHQECGWKVATVATRQEKTLSNEKRKEPT
jgi:hypothetical protein